MTSRVDAGTWRLVELTGRPPEQFDPIWKLGFILEHPLHFPSATIASFSDPGELWRQLIGVLGLFDTVLHPWVYPVLSITLVIACISRVELNPSTRSWTAIAATAGATGYALSVFLIFYLVWTPIDADQVWGIQGRYFLPALPPLAIAAACFIRRSLGEAAQAASAGGGALLSGAACVEAIWRVEWMI